MARTLLPVVGGAIGGFFGGPMGARIGFAVGSIVGNVVDPVTVKGPSIGETGAQTSAEGAPRAIVYGTAHVTGNVIASGELVRRWIKERGGGKGGAPKVKTEHVYRTFAIRICEGPVGGVLRVWEDDRLVYDVRPGSPIVDESVAWIENKTIYLGTEEQLPDPTLQAQVSGVADTPAYRGTVYIVIDSEDLTDRRGSIPQYRFEVARSVETEVHYNYSPLVIGAWTGAQPQHSLGSVNFSGGSYSGTDFEAAVSARAADMVATHPTVAYSTVFVAYRTSLNDLQNKFAGGATLVGDPQVIYFSMAPGEPDAWLNTAIDPKFCGPMEIAGAEPDDGRVYAIRDETLLSASGFAAVKLYSHDATRPPAYSEIFNNCSNYPASGGNFPIAAGAYIVEVQGERIPAPPTGYASASGTAKQLAAIEYRAGALYQNALGPCLLPGDPDYDNAEFWSDQRAAAIARGDLRDDVTSPVIVSDYAVRVLPSSVAGDPVVLSAIVDDIHRRCGVPVENYDVSELTDMVDGLVLAGEYTGADAIDTLRRVYFFDRSEHDGKIYFPKRGKAVVDVLTFDDLVEEPDTSMREQAIEYPAKVHLFYQHAASGYARVKATAQRSSPDVRVVGEQSVEVPVVLDEDEAARISHKMQKVSWADAEGEVTLALPESFIALTPADCVGLSLRDRVRRLRIEEMQIADGRIQLTMRVDRQSAYTSDVTGIPIPAPTPPPSTIVGATVLAVLDIPARVDAEDDLGLYLAVSAVEPAWYGALVERSLDGGASFVDAAQIERSMVIGVLTADVGTASAHYTDATNRMRVRLLRASHALESITEQAFLSGGGAFAVESADGSWEILQYRDADDLGDQAFELSTLHRGRLATTPAAHASGALVVFLDDVEHVPAQAAWIGQQLTHRATSFGETTESSIEQALTYAGRSQLEWPIAYLQLERDSGDVISGVWTPRHRFGSDDYPVPSINFIGYRVTIDDGSTEVVLDTVDPHFSFDASALASPVTVSVAALNRITGAGPATVGTV